LYQSWEGTYLSILECPAGHGKPPKCAATGGTAGDKPSPLQIAPSAVQMASRPSKPRRERFGSMVRASSSFLGAISGIAGSLLGAFAAFIALATAPAAATQNCSTIVRHDEMADCYFKQQNWAKVIQAYDTTPPRSLDYPDDATQNAADVRGSYQRAIAYKHLGNHSEEQIWIGLAYRFPHAQTWVSKYVWSQIVAEYRSSGQDRQDAQLKAALNTPAQHADALWARDQGMSDEEVQLVKYRGRPCHVETYDAGDSYHKETFWYCDADGQYQESYTFVNGHQTDHYKP